MDLIDQVLGNSLYNAPFSEVSIESVIYLASLWYGLGYSYIR